MSDEVLQCRLEINTQMAPLEEGDTSRYYAKSVHDLESTDFGKSRSIFCKEYVTVSRSASLFL